MSVAKTSLPGANQSVANDADGLDYEEFGEDLYVIPELPISKNPVQDVPPPSKADEDRKVQTLINTPTLDWQQTFDGFGSGRGFGRGMGGHGFGRWLDSEANKSIGEP